MRRLRLEALALVAGLAMFIAPPVSASNGGLAPGAPAQVKMTVDGRILVASNGMTLYTSQTDKPGKSLCTNVVHTTMTDDQSGLGEQPQIGAKYKRSCIEKWPAYLADETAKPVGNFSLIERPEGGNQWAFNGQPLYFSIKDHKPGDRNGGTGGGLGGRRGGFVFASLPLVLPAELTTTEREEGLVIATANSRPVYTPASTDCRGCDTLFKPITAPAMATVDGYWNNEGLWSIEELGAGRFVYAFKGKPLYQAPESLDDHEIRKMGGWDLVVLQERGKRPAEIGTQMTLTGEVYTDAEGHTLYVFSCRTGLRSTERCDDPGDPAGYWVALCGSPEACAHRWRPYLAGDNAKPSGDWSIVEVPNPIFTDPLGVTYPPDAPRVRAWAHRGRPVYTYYQDKNPGDIWGDRTGGLWGSYFGVLRVPGPHVGI